MNLDLKLKTLWNDITTQHDWLLGQKHTAFTFALLQKSKRPLAMKICREHLSMSQMHQSDNGRVQLSPQAKQEVIDETIWGDVFFRNRHPGRHSEKAIDLYMTPKK